MKIFRNTILFIIGYIILTIALLVAVFIFRDKVMPFYAVMFEQNVAPTNDNYYIVVLGGNPTIRLAQAMRIYENNITRGIVTPIIITEPRKRSVHVYHREYEEDFDRECKDEAVLIRDILKHRKIRYKISKSLKYGATSTFDEATDLAKFIKRHPYIKSILIITDNFHTKRAYKTFKEVFEMQDLDTNIFMQGVENPDYDENNWYRTEAGLKTYIIETGTWIAHAFSYANPSGIKED